MSAASQVLAWARDIPVSCTVVGEVDGPRRTEVELLGERLELLEHRGRMAMRLVRPLRRPRLLLAAPVAPSQMARVLAGLGY